jgi:hypothetical protein
MSSFTVVVMLAAVTVVVLFVLATVPARSKGDVDFAP